MPNVKQLRWLVLVALVAEFAALVCVVWEVFLAPEYENRVSAFIVVFVLTSIPVPSLALALDALTNSVKMTNAQAAAAPPSRTCPVHDQQVE